MASAPVGPVGAPYLEWHMPKLTERAARAGRRAIDEVETRVLVAEGKKSLRTKVARAKRITTKALKTGAIVGAVVATAVVMRERKKQRKLDA